MKNKAVRIGALVGLLYALVPTLLVLHDFFTPGYSQFGIFFQSLTGITYSDILWPFLYIPLFWPIGITYVFLVMFVASDSLSNNAEYILTLSILFINVGIWFFIGAGIGFIISKIKRNKNVHKL